MDTTSCDGFLNYPTAVVAMVFKNDRNTSEFIRRIARDKRMTEIEKDDAIEKFVREGNPLVDSNSIYASFIEYAMEQISWKQITDYFKEN